MGKTTKKIQVCKFIGSKKSLREDVLPTNRDILRYYLWLDKNFTISRIVVKVLEIWNYAGIATVTKQRASQCLRALHRQYRDLAKATSKKYCVGATYKLKLADFNQTLNKLFDVV